MGRKIVVVEDDRSTLAMLEKNLIMRGFWVYGARDGEEALQLIKKEHPDLVLSDMLLPKVHGLDILQAIKESPSLQNIKVIMMTGVYKGSAGKKEAIDGGADDFIMKPLDIEKLCERIFALLELDEEEFVKEFVKSDPAEEES